MEHAGKRTAQIVLRSILSTWAALLVAGASTADEQPEVVDGRNLFLVHCSSCHGSDGRGQTSLSELLRVETPDLTRITIRHNGWFPEALVQEIIDGRFKIHGEGKMPIWGRVLRREEIIAISEHLYQIQVSPP